MGWFVILRLRYAPAQNLIPRPETVSETPQADLARDDLATLALGMLLSTCAVLK